MRAACLDTAAVLSLLHDLSPNSARRFMFVSGQDMIFLGHRNPQYM